MDANKIAEIIAAHHIGRSWVIDWNFIDSLADYFESASREHSEDDCLGWIEYPCPQHEEGGDYTPFDSAEFKRIAKGAREFR